MLDWLTGSGRPKELPEYSALRSIPSRGLPAVRRSGVRGATKRLPNNRIKLASGDGLAALYGLKEYTDEGSWQARTDSVTSTSHLGRFRGDSCS